MKLRSTCIHTYIHTYIHACIHTHRKEAEEEALRLETEEQKRKEEEAKVNEKRLAKVGSYTCLVCVYA